MDLYNTEKWADIKGYEGIYKISTLGNVKNIKTGKILKPSMRGEYLKYNLCYKNKNKTVSIHRLVAEAFLSNKNNYTIVNHKDENKLNNCVENLEWCTHSYNVNYGDCCKKIGLANSIKRKGKPSPKKENSKKCVKIILENTGEIFYSRMGACEKYNINASRITQCCIGNRKSAGVINGEKAIWKYYNEVIV